MTRLLVFAAVLIGGYQSASSQDKLLPWLGKETNAEIDRLLDQKRNMVFNDATLGDVVTFLIDNGIPTYVDERALNDLGIDVSIPITFRQPSIRLRDGLKLALQTIDLSFTVRNERLLITTPEEEEYRLITRVYDVRNLVELVPNPYYGFSMPSTSTIVYQYDFDSLIETITGTVASESWEHMGGMGTIKPFSTRRMLVIVVAQTYDIHRQLRSLLSELAVHGGSAPLPHPVAPWGLDRQPNTFLNPRTQQAVQPKGGIRSSQLRTTGQ